MKYGFISSKDVYQEWRSQQSPDFRVNQDLALNYINEAVSLMIKADLYVHQIILGEVHNYKIKIPKHFRRMHQVLYSPLPNKCTRTDIVEWTKKHYKSHNCDLKIQVQCKECAPQPCSCTSGIVNLTQYEAEKEFPELQE